jgi:RNA polymerase-binding transcription factor DksA
MPSKKKAAKPAQKAPVKKSAVPAKKAAPKPVAKPAPVAKKAAQKPVVKPAPVAKKAAPKVVAPVVKKVVIAPAKKPSVIKPAAKPIVAPKLNQQPPKPVASTPLPPLPLKPLKPAFKPVTNTPIPIPKKTVTPPPKQAKVVIPDMKTKTVRKYQPDFTKSVLDQPIEQQSGPTMRYSDAELIEFREIIQKKLDTAKKELTYLQGLITRKDEMGGDNDDARYMTMEDGSMSMEREQLSQMASRQITFIDHLEKAMMRIENKTYGICRVTGKLIDKARLKAVPHATLSIEAKQMQK